MKFIRHIDTFSGIGGAALAIDEVFGSGNVEHVFCEIDPFCRAVLMKHWPRSYIHGDIRTFLPEEKDEGAYILTGGFPCQPFSQAGLRKGTDDNRFLWPEMLRAIRQFRPRWVVAENVSGLLTIERGMVFERVCSDLEAEGYGVQAFVVPAAGVGAPHLRNRVWIVAHADDIARDRAERGRPSEASVGTRESRKEIFASREPSGADSHVPKDREHDGHGSAPADPAGVGGRRRGDGDQGRGARQIQAPRPDTSRSRWEEHWFPVTARLCRMDDGLSVRMDGLALTKAAHRKERLKALGNAWCPQVAIEIMKAIKNAS